LHYHVLIVEAGRPLGTARFVRELEQATLRCLVLQKGGRPSHGRAAQTEQKALAFETVPLN